jgi:TATA-box binding protein (TBP) (component of TFIID and TFIIIB)
MDSEWMQFISQQAAQDSCTEWKPAKPVVASTGAQIDPSVDDCPKCDELFISTKTKVLFLNQGLDIHRIFWEIPITEYWRPHSGVIKKQMKIVSKTPEEYEEYRTKLVGIPYYVETVIKQINNPAARRLKFKDERKITVGLSKKDIMNCRGKVKNAFYNCFAMILRFIHDGAFREIHVKIFNTGKMEIPGILNAEILTTVKQMILDTLRPHTLDEVEELDFVENENEDSVLINSNFNCGFYINRDRLHAILRSEKYNIEAAYDPCSYPGVKCKFYFNHDIGFDVEKQRGTVMQSDCVQKMSELGYNKKYTEVSFMIFRTGSCLIVGNCSEQILRFIFDFIKTILKNEYTEICVPTEDTIVKNKNNKIRKKTILVSQQYYSTILGTR